MPNKGAKKRKYDKYKKNQVNKKLGRTKNQRKKRRK
tara:strand:+ start:477 stop:584 length:108 start_codon:yes stop_codon:yes gene_type:complete